MKIDPNLNPGRIPQHGVPADCAYLAHWLDAVKGDNKLIVQAAAQAQKAVDLVLATTYKEDEDEKS